MATTVLIVDDDRFNRRLYRELLEAEGLAVEAASSGRAALEAARVRRPALVVVDVEMPGMSGLEVTEALKAAGETRAVPVLVISAHAMGDAGAAARGAGADGFLCKPLRFPEFQRTVHALIAAAEGREARVGGLGRDVG